MNQPILQPFLALILLTFIVWTYMYVQRIRFTLAHRISPQRIATPELISSVLPEHVNRPSNNLKNLFELPVIFYVVCGVSLALHQTSPGLTTLAWIYVGLRTVHSAIHCTVNVVALRFAAYFASSIILWAMVAKLAYQAL
jgi:hypothetical protein